MIAVEFVYSVKTKLRLNSPEKYSSSFDKIDVIIVCYENIYTVATALFTSSKMPLFLLCNNEHFHPYFAIIFFKMKSASFSVVYTKQIWTPFLALAIFSCLSTERNHVTERHGKYLSSAETPAKLRGLCGGERASIVSKVYYYLFIIHSKYFPNSDWLKAHA